MEEETAKRAAYCLSCPVPRCQTGCPVPNCIRDEIKALKEDDVEKAGKILRANDPFPEFTSRLCDCAKQCQGHCVRGIRSNPVEIQLLERYVANHTKRHIQVGKETGRAIALVGAGIANLSAALYFREAGFSVDAYEKDEQVGGAIYTGIPGYRFDKKYLDEVKKDLENVGVKFHFGVSIGKDISLEELQSKYDAVLLGIGAQVENQFGMGAKEGWVPGLTLLRDFNVRGKQSEYASQYHKAFVWGGGNVAMDCARSLIRVMKNVTVVYRRSRLEMPASALEIEEAEQEGVKFAFLTNIEELKTDENGKVTGAHLIKMELGEKDASGRASCHSIPGSDFEEEADLIVPAIGQKVDLSAIDPKLAKGEGHETNFPKVYLVGDCHLGPKTVAAAIGDGRDAAKEVIAKLS